MFLQKLNILKEDGTLIRTIPFHGGVNFVVNKNSSNISGNNIGKTTLLRVIDYIFGSTGEDIYTDSENKKTSINNKVYGFLTSNRVLVQLFFSHQGKDGVIERNFVNSDDKQGVVMKINGISFDGIKKYNIELRKLFLEGYLEKPGIRNIISFFVRHNHDRMNNFLKTLHNSTTAEEYKLVWYSLFGFNDISLLIKEADLCKQRKEQEKALISFKKQLGFTVTDIGKKLQSDIDTIQAQIGVKKGKEADSKVFQSYNIMKDNLLTIKSEIDKLYENHETYKVQIEMIKDTIKSFKSELLNEVNAQFLKLMYEQAQVYLDNIHVAFNNLIENRRKTITNRLLDANQNLKVLTKKYKDNELKLEKLLERQQSIGSFFNEEGISNYISFEGELNILHEELGHKKEQLSLYKKYIDVLANIEEDLSNIDYYNNDIEKNIEIVNNFMVEYSTFALSEESHAMKLHNDAGHVFVDNILNPSPGRKKSEVIVYDMAYLSFLNEKGINLPHFFMYDTIEDIDKDNELKNIINLIDKKFGGTNPDEEGQFIFTTLYEKLGGLENDFVEKNKILELSSSDRFFRIESLS